MIRAVRVTAAVVLVKARGLLNLLRGGDRTGLTVPCHGRCGDTSVHDSHLARGALDYLGRRS